MRCLERNKTSFYYALYEGKVAIEDEYGNETGEYRVEYGRPRRYSANISAATGEAQIEQFGSFIQYDKVIITDDLNCPINEYSVLCVDSAPSYDGEGELVYDYVVTKVARSLNTVSYAISKVTVS